MPKKFPTYLLAIIITVLITACGGSQPAQSAEQPVETERTYRLFNYGVGGAVSSCSDIDDDHCFNKLTINVRFVNTGSEGINFYALGFSLVDSVGEQHWARSSFVETQGECARGSHYLYANQERTCTIQFDFDPGLPSQILFPAEVHFAYLRAEGNTLILEESP